MLKKFLLAVCLIPAIVFCQQNVFKIKGHVANYKQGDRIFLAYTIKEKMIIDSSTITDGEFLFKGSALDNERGYLQMLHENKDLLTSNDVSDNIGIFLETGTIYVETPDLLKHARIKGTPFNETEQALRDSIAPFTKQDEILYAEYKAAQKIRDIKKETEINDTFFEMDAKRKLAIDFFILSHKDSYLGFSLLNSYVNPSNDADRAIRLFDQMSEPLRNSPEGITYNSMLTDARKLAIGTDAPNFSLPDSLDKQISLNSFRGKYVLIDFWASWCGPCMTEIPNLIKAYEKFKEKNFTILGVSLDTNKNSWLYAVDKYKLPWQQVSDLKGMESLPSNSYKVQAIPANFLIDPTGKIVAKNLRGASLDKKLSEILL